MLISPTRSESIHFTLFFSSPRRFPSGPGNGFCKPPGRSRPKKGRPNSPVIKLQDMFESVANILRLLVGYCIDIRIADIVEALPGLLYSFKLDFAKVFRKILVIRVGEIP